MCIRDRINLAADYDIFLNTTNFDNTPVSVIEAMALGLPVVSTNVGGIPFLIEDEKDGLLTPKEDIIECAEQLVKIMTDNELAITLGEQARKKAISFDWKSVKTVWLEVLS